jgi:hypothetical protein
MCLLKILGNQENQTLCILKYCESWYKFSARHLKQLIFVLILGKKRRPYVQPTVLIVGGL